MNYWNCDASCMLTSLLIWDVGNFKLFVFVVQSVRPAVVEVIHPLKDVIGGP
jgi:hypothetical protein